MKQRTDFTCSIRGGFVKFIHDAVNQTYVCRLGKGEQNFVKEISTCCAGALRAALIDELPSPRSVNPRAVAAFERH
jgi:hypothetical protein